MPTLLFGHLRKANNCIRSESDLLQPKAGHHTAAVDESIEAPILRALLYDLDIWLEGLCQHLARTHWQRLAVR